MKEIPKAYEPQQYEDDIYKRWEKSGLFNPDVCIEKGVCKKNSTPFVIDLPLPNVTGTLHIGHAAMLAIQDTMIRYHRMKGDKTLWMPGTDSAAVATEAKVEKMLIEKEGMERPKEKLGREKFLERVNQFAAESHDIIVNQLRKMGSSLDWSREAFTMDEQRYKAVYAVFKKMYDDGLIYRGDRVVNWSVKGQSTCSDDELVHVERPAKLYTFRYGKDFPIAIATTRPETKLGDTAIAVNPKDKRYKKYIGQTFSVDVGAAKPLNIKIIADEQVDMEFGTGAVGVTPAHSMVDFEMYQRHKAKGEDIGLIQVIGEDGRMTAAAGRDYVGLTTLKAREKFVNYLRDNDLLKNEEDTIQNVGTSDRFGDVVEALPKLQWFIDVNKKFIVESKKLKGIKSGQEYSLKELIQTAVRSQQIKIIPERFDKIYFNWVDNLRDWCISRQIWYGHRIPVWYRQTSDFRLQTSEPGTESIYVDVEPPEDSENWVQDPDTLDTWFSSGLWTFSTLGYPNLNAEDLKNFHPTSVLETGYDILFFWVARMVLMSTYVLGEIPFHTVYLHGLVRDEQGRKMSKSLGNVINPLDTIKKYGADATRLSLLIGNTPGNDTKLSEEKIAGFRNFANKLWNISRFIIGKMQDTNYKIQISIEQPRGKTLADRWILESLDLLVADVKKDIDEFRFSTAGEKLRDFTWNDLADWYLEIAKIENNKQKILNYILNTILKLWHPFMPFVTEAIWGEIYGENEMLMVEKFPTSAKSLADILIMSPVQSGFYEIIKIIRGIRFLRADYKIDPAKKLNAVISAGDKIELFEENKQIIKHLARLEEIKVTKSSNRPDNSVSFVESGVEVYIDLEGVVDFTKEKDRISKEVTRLNGYITGLEQKLSNKEFVKNAPSDIVQKEKEKLREGKEKLSKLEGQLNQFV